MVIITSEKIHIAVNWIARVRLRKHKQYRVYLRSLARGSNYKQTH